MLKYFIPIAVVDHFTEIDINKLKKNNIKLFLCDVDNTLVRPDEPYISEEGKIFLEELSKADIQPVLVSNNTKERINKFNNGLNYPAYSMALKPLPLVYKKIKKDFKHINHKNMLSFGDQVLTDVLGSNIAKIKVILTNRITKNDLKVTKVNRFFENMIIKTLKKRELWPNG